MKVNPSNLGSSQAVDKQSQEILRKLKLGSIVSTVEKVLNLRITLSPESKPTPLNDEIRAVILSTNRKHHQIYGHFNRGLMHLLEFWHSFDAERIMQEYKVDMDEYEKP
jgi:hypothetical protein